LKSTKPLPDSMNKPGKDIEIWHELICLLALFSLLIGDNEIYEFINIQLHFFNAAINLFPFDEQTLCPNPSPISVLFPLFMVIHKIPEKKYSEEMFYKVFSLNPIPTAITTISDPRFVQVNEAFCLLTGYEQEQIIDKNVSDLGLWMYPEKRTEIVKTILKKKRVRNVEVQIKDASGSVHECLFFAEIVTYEKKPHMLAMAIDITDHKDIEQTLLKTEARYRAIFENTLNGVAVYKAIGNGENFLFIGFNSAAENIDNIKRKDVIGKTILQVFPGSKDFGLLDVMKRVWQTGVPEHFPISLYKDNRIEGWRENFIYKLPSGEIVSVYSDQTARKKAEEDLRESQRGVMTLISNLPGMAYRCKNDPERTLDFISEGCLKITGYSPDDLVENRKVTYAQLIHPDDRDMVWNTVQAALKEKKHFQMIYRIKTAKGKDRWVWEQGVGVFDSDGSLCALEGFATDITEQRVAQDALRRSEEKFSKAFHASPDWISITTLDEGLYIDVNEAFLRKTGYELHEVLGRTSIELGIWENPQDRDAIIQKIRKEGGIRNEEVRFRTKAGNIRNLLWSAEQFQFGGERCILSVGRDVTEHKRLEEELRQSQKMEAVGQFADGIAHDFNNILTALTSYSELLLYNIDHGKEVRKNVEKIIEVENSAKLLIRQLMTFSRKQVFEPQVLDLNEIINNITKLIGPLIGSQIELRLFLERDTCMLLGDRSQMELIIMNLAANARDAMPKGGKLTIETANVYLDQVFVRKHAGLKPGNYVRLICRDTGEGMDEETISHIFEPFFTTKEEGRGTGLGLSTVYRIVKKTGGEIWLSSKVGKGTRVNIFLPRFIDKQKIGTKIKKTLSSKKFREKAR
jgi:PAS domain S-box-containing protein